jgi:hypothetical protein
MASLVPEEPVSLDSFYAGGPRTFQEAFPPFCVKSHWDPMLVTQHILPSAGMPAMAFDPRPEAYICTTYQSTSPGDAPLPADVLGPAQPPQIPQALLGPQAYIRAPTDSSPTVARPGGAAGLGAPYSGYASAVDVEGDLLRLDESLTKCKELRYTPRPLEIEGAATNVVPNESDAGNPERSQVVSKTAGCREADDEAAWNRSGRLFFNNTKLDRYHPTAKNGPLAC